MSGVVVVGAAGRGVFLGEKFSKLFQTLKELNKYIYLLQFPGSGAAFVGVFLGGKFKQLAETLNILPLLPCYFAVVARMGAGWYFYTFVPFVPCFRAFVCFGVFVSPGRCIQSGPAAIVQEEVAFRPGVLPLFQCAGVLLWVCPG